MGELTYVSHALILKGKSFSYVRFFWMAPIGEVPVERTVSMAGV